MLRKRSRATTGGSKQALMADFGSSSYPTDNYRRSTSSFFSSPWDLFTGFTSKGFTDAEVVMSPTSPLDTKPFSVFKNPFFAETETPKISNSEKINRRDKLESRVVCLGLVDALTDEKSDPKLSNTESRMVLFGSQLKIQIPPLPPSALSPSDSPKSPADFGIKTRHSQMGPFSAALSSSPPSAKKSPFESPNSAPGSSNSPRDFIESLSATEDYTCVISRGPNPTTTHIFDDCIIQSCCGVVGFSASNMNDDGFFFPDASSQSYPS